VLPVLSSLSSTVTFAAARLFGWGTHSAGDSLLWVRHGRDGFPLAIAPLCAGSSTITGWLLVGGALSLTTHGLRRSKFFWLATGCITAFAANAARLIALVAVGHFAGAGAAANVHLWLGAVALAAVVLGGILSMNLFGVSFRAKAPRRRNWTPPRARVSHGRPLGVLAAGVLSLLIVLSGPGITPAAALIGPLGEGRSLALSSSAPALENYTLASVESIDWAKQFFGRSSRWVRYRYDQAATTDGPVAVTVDAQVNSDPDRFTRYSVDRCLEFHHHDPQRIRKVDLGYGLLGDAATWQEGSRTWQTLSWVIPVRVPDGTRRFERVMVSAEVPTAGANAADGTQVQALQAGENVLDHIGRQLLGAAVVAGNAA
jgi:exosortase/archaeosortase family protein